MQKARFGLLWFILGAIVLGILAGMIFPEWLARIFVTFNGIFSQFLGFSIPLIILGLVAPAIAELGRGAGKWLVITTAIAYVSTLFSGFLAYGSAIAIFPHILQTGELAALENPEEHALSGFFTIEIPAIFGVMTALVLAFVLGIGMTLVEGNVMARWFKEFRHIVIRLIEKIIIPLLPLHVFGIFVNLSYSGVAAEILIAMGGVVIEVLALCFVILALQYLVAGAIAGVNPVRAFINMLPAYGTALGTSSSAGTIPVTVSCVRNNKVSGEVTDFVVPLCATIHLSGSTAKITTFALAIMVITDQPISFTAIAGFIFMLGVTMVAAPGVPGGAIAAASGLLPAMLGFNDAQVALMFATYIALDSVGTATNVTGDGAIALIINKLSAGTIGGDKAVALDKNDDEVEAR